MYNYLIQFYNLRLDKEINKFTSEGDKGGNLLYL